MERPSGEHCLRWRDDGCGSKGQRHAGRPHPSGSLLFVQLRHYFTLEIWEEESLGGEGVEAVGQ